MKNWINKNYKAIIIAAFLVPIITVAVVSISHVTMWYGLSNPFTWAIYLSIGIEIAALSALAAISANMGSKVYFPFSIVTLIQFIGNIFFAYSFIDINSQTFKDWVDLVSPLVSYMGVEATDFVGHKRFLAFFAGGMLPVISLSFLHMLVKFTEEDRKNKVVDEPKDDPKEEPKEEPVKIDASDIVSEVSRIRLSENDLKILEKVLLTSPSPNEVLFNAAENYKKKSDDEILKQAEDIRLKRASKEIEKMEESREDEVRSNKTEEVSPESMISEDIVETNDKEDQREALIKMMELDQELGLYDEPLDDPLIKEDTYNIAKSIEQPEVIPALSDEEVREMFMDEWERKFDLVEEEEFSTTEPTEEEIEQNFSTITENSENIFQDEAPKFNIDDSYTTDMLDVKEESNGSFWRDHLNEESNEDLKKK